MALLSDMKELFLCCCLWLYVIVLFELARKLDKTFSVFDIQESVIPSVLWNGRDDLLYTRQRSKIAEVLLIFKVCLSIARLNVSHKT